MPRLARLYVKTSLVYLVAAFLGWVLLGTPLLEGLPIAAATRLGQTHLFVVGWISQLIFGVAFWLFPRTSREAPYGRVWLAWAAYPLLNLGLVMRVAFEPSVLLHGWGRWGLLAAALLQWFGALGQAAYLWTRVRGR